jgi:hypothetical protein
MIADMARRNFIFLISLLSGVAMADTPNLSLSGFAYNTYFSDSDFHRSRSVIAGNFDADWSRFAIRGQVSNSD